MEREAEHKDTWPFSLEGTLGWAGCVLSGALTQLLPQVASLWYTLAAISLFFILDSSLRWILVERAGYGRFKRAGLIVPASYAQSTEPTGFHRICLAGVVALFLGWIFIKRKQAAIAIPTAPAAIAQVNSNKVNRVPHNRKAPDNPRKKAAILANDIFKFLNIQEKTCPQWNNIECRRRVGALFQTLFSDRLKQTISDMRERGIIGPDDLNLTCGTNDSPEWIRNCAEQIQQSAHGSTYWDTP